MDISTEQLRHALLFLVALVLSITVHEFGHAWAATRLGDPLPRAQGRLSLKPIRHIDWVGTILFPFIAQLSPGLPLFGWGKPVQTNPLYYTKRLSPRTGQMLVAIAGPLMNLVMAVLVSAVVIVGVRTGVLGDAVVQILISNLIVLNIVLMFFNLLPIPPLDGGSVLAWVLPRSLQFVVNFLQRWGFLILIGVMVSPLRGVIMYPVAAVTELWTAGVAAGAGL